MLTQLCLCCRLPVQLVRSTVGILSQQSAIQAHLATAPLPPPLPPHPHSHTSALTHSALMAPLSSLSIHTHIGQLRSLRQPTPKSLLLASLAAGVVPLPEVPANCRNRTQCHSTGGRRQAHLQMPPPHPLPPPPHSHTRGLAHPASRAPLTSLQSCTQTPASCAHCVCTPLPLLLASPCSWCATAAGSAGKLSQQNAMSFHRRALAGESSGAGSSSRRRRQQQQPRQTVKGAWSRVLCFWSRLAGCVTRWLVLCRASCTAPSAVHALGPSIGQVGRV